MGTVMDIHLLIMATLHTPIIINLIQLKEEPGFRCRNMGSFLLSSELTMSEVCDYEKTASATSSYDLNLSSNFATLVMTINSSV